MAQSAVEVVMSRREHVTMAEYERVMQLPYDAPEAIAPAAGGVDLILSVGQSPENLVGRVAWR
jgi:hydroxymethylglutaryl-CoA synthase